MKYFRIENFLSCQENKELLTWASSNPKAFNQSTVTTGEANYRRSQVAYSCSLVNLVTDKIKLLIPVINNALDLTQINFTIFESQLTAHGEGDFFKIHTDNNDPQCSRRILSYVYYFHAERKGFRGGELALYSYREKRDAEHGTISERTLITPDNNSLVCFPSMTWHEVLPVIGSSAFDSCRFTVNGWINCQ